MSMWGHLSSLGQNVAQITKAVGAQLLDAAGDDERLDAADFSDGDTAECSANEPGAVLAKKVQRLQDKLSRARDEIDRLNDIRARATESVTQTIKNKDDEINELRELLAETRMIVSESLSPRSQSPEAAPKAESGTESHVATPIIHHKIKASERVSLLTRKFHEEKRSHIAALHQIKSENSKFKERVHSLEAQLSARDSRIAELENHLAKQSDDLESHKMVIARLRSEKASASDQDQAASLQKKIVDQAETIAELEARCRDVLEPQLDELRSELERLKRDQGFHESSDASDQSSLLETERASLKAALKDLGDLRARSETYLEVNRQLNEKIAKLTLDLERSQHDVNKIPAAPTSDAFDSDVVPYQDYLQLREQLKDLDALRQRCETFIETNRELNDRVAQVTSDLEKSKATITELEALKSDSANSDVVPRQDLIQLRDKARAQLRQLSQKCKTLEAENANLRSQSEKLSQNRADEDDHHSALAEMEQRLSTFQRFVDDLLSAMPLVESEPSLDNIRDAIVNRIRTAPFAADSPSEDSTLLNELKTILGLDEVNRLRIIAEIRACLDRAQTAMAQNAAMTAAYEQAQESVDNLTASQASMKKEMENLLRRISELQADCRKAFAEEKALQTENAELKKEIDVLQIKVSESARVQGQKHSSSISRINSLEKQVQNLDKEVGNKEAVIRELNAQLELRTKQLVEAESAQDTWLEQAQRDRETLLAESTRLRQSLETVSSDYESRIVALQEQIRKERDTTYQAQLDLQTFKDLASDYSDLQLQLRAKAEECINLSDALDNLQAVLDQFQLESDSKLKEAELRLQASLDAAEEGRLAVQELIQVTRSLKQSEAAVVQLEAKLSSSRKYALQIESDNAALRHAMQQTMDRIKTFSSDENLVDRRIVNKLLVTYLERKASAEVINLMIKMLGFTEEQKRLVLESQRPKGLISSLSSLIPTPYSAEDDVIDDEPPEARSGQQNLADLWVSFLLKETGSGSRRSSISSLPSPHEPATSRKISSRPKSPTRSPSSPVPDVPIIPTRSPSSPVPDVPITPRRSPTSDIRSPNRNLPPSPRRTPSPKPSLTPSST